MKFDLKVGDYCTAYRKGIHKVISIEYPTQRASTALVTLQAVLDSSYNKHTAKHTCDIAWCKKVSKEELLKKLENQYSLWKDNVEKYLA